MISRRALPFLLFLLLGRTMLLPSPLHAQPMTLADSTIVEAWQLANGLHVVTHTIRGCRGVSITVAVPNGSDADPRDRPGLARLAAEVQMMAPVGVVPERSEAELASSRPLGWSIKVTGATTQLSEIATPEQFPGVLHQVAQRMGGVTVTDHVLKTALATVRAELGADRNGPIDLALHQRVGEYARGLGEAAIADRAAGRGLERVSARELDAQLRRRFAAHGAVLAIAGDLRGINLHALMSNEFGGLPAGDPLPPAPPPALHSSARKLTWPGLHHGEAVVGVIAPALADTSHPDFLLHTLLLGEYVKEHWEPDTLISTSFRYTFLDDPALVRFFPPVWADSLTPEDVSGTMLQTTRSLRSMLVAPDEYPHIIERVDWLLGGPMPPGVLAGIRSDPSSLNYSCNALATRELLGGESFWIHYRRRFRALTGAGLDRWADYIANPRHQVVLLLAPPGR